MPMNRLQFQAGLGGRGLDAARLAAPSNLRPSGLGTSSDKVTQRLTLRDTPFSPGQ